MTLPEIVGISGTSGAGKDTTGELLTHYGYKFTSLSDTLRAELDVRELPHTRENLRTLSAEWHREFGPDYLVHRTIELYRAEKQSKQYKGLAIGSIRRPAEAAVIVAEKGLVMWIDAEQRVRYDRIQAAHRGRAEDAATFEEWAADEAAEMTPPANDDGSSLNMAGVRDMADVRIDNSFTDAEHYDEHIVELFSL